MLVLDLLSGNIYNQYFVCLAVSSLTQAMELVDETWQDCTLGPGEVYYLGGTFGGPL